MLVSPHNVTIIIPVYCVTQESLGWLDECLRSVYLQETFVIVHDDGSPLDITPIVSKYSKVLQFGGEHVGVSHARNEAISVAVTDFIFPLDCDDRLKPGAIKSLLDVWDGTPTYCDVEKFGDTVVPHYDLLNFDCAHIFKYVGFSSVNVLHTKEQWESIGGYDETIDFYEDGEYNARLFLRYCGKRFPQPLVEYRIHKGQRTDIFKHRSGTQAKMILQKIGEYEMSCPGCRGRRTNPLGTLSTMSVARTVPIVDPANMPLTQGNLVLAHYVGGKGRGNHYYEGIRSQQHYKVKYDQFVYVLPDDTRLEDDYTNRSLLIRVVRKEPVKVYTPSPVTKTVNKPAVPKAVIPEPKPAEFKPVVVKELPDIHNMSLKQIIASDDITPENVSPLLKIEQEGLNRAKVVSYLEGLLK